MKWATRFQLLWRRIERTAHIRGLERAIEKLEAQLEHMLGPEHQPPNDCCPSCYWGQQLRDVELALERRRHWLRVLRCRERGLRPQKTRTIAHGHRRQCGACGGRGRTTIASFGRCNCGEPGCPGRGRCHSCGGRGWVWEPRVVVIRPWPEGL